VHEDYIASGAEVITVNTFATSALLFNALGRDDDFINIGRTAVAIAKEAAKDRPIAVAGSMPAMRTVQSGPTAPICRANGRKPRRAVCSDARRRGLPKRALISF
jgi:methionine synthase I (cobalamin-dependent)